MWLKRAWVSVLSPVNSPIKLSRKFSVKGNSEITDWMITGLFPTREERRSVYSRNDHFSSFMLQMMIPLNHETSGKKALVAWKRLIPKLVTPGCCVPGRNRGSKNYNPVDTWVTDCPVAFDQV